MSENHEQADENVVPLETPQVQAPAKGLFPRSAIWWGVGLLVLFLCIMAARDMSASRPSGVTAKPQGAAASVASTTLGPKPADTEIALIAKRQIEAEQAQASAAAASLQAGRGPGVAPADGVSEQIAAAGGTGNAAGKSQLGYQPVVPGTSRAPAGQVQPNVPVPSHPSPMGDVRGPGARPNQPSGASADGEVDVAAVQNDVAKHMGAIVALNGDDDSGTGVVGAVRGAVDAVQRSTGGGSEAQDLQKATEAATRQVASLMKNGAEAGAPGQTLNAVAAVAHPTSRDVSWLKDYANEGARAASDAQVSLVRAKTLPSRDVVLEGTRVPIVTLPAVNSDQPGEISATSRYDVYDSLTQTHVLIPRGTRFRGRYSSEIRPGQSRLLFAFNRMVLPDGRIVDLTGAQGSDNLGRAGVEGNVDNHFMQMFGYSLAIAVLGNKIGNNGTSTSTVGAGGVVSTASLAGQVVGQVAQQILQRNASIPPTITKEGGTPLFITITSDLALDPWKNAK